MWTTDTRRMDSLCSITSSRTWYTDSFRTELLPVRAFISTFQFTNGIRCPSSLSKTAQFASELTLVRLVLSVATAFTEFRGFIKVFSGRTTFLAFLRGSCSKDFSDSGLASNIWTAFTFLRAIIKHLLSITEHKSQESIHAKVNIPIDQFHFDKFQPDKLGMTSCLGCKKFQKSKVHNQIRQLHVQENRRNQISNPRKLDLQPCLVKHLEH